MGLTEHNRGDLVWSRAIWLGGLCAFPSGLAIAACYYLQHVSSDRLQHGWDWGLWTLAIAIATPIVGASWAAGASWGVGLGSTRDRSPAASGFLGGTLGAIVPMLICVGGFGALHAPYVGTAVVGFGLLLSFSLFAILHAVRPEPAAPAPNWIARALATVLVVVPFGLAIMAALAHVFPWETIACVRDYVTSQTGAPVLLIAVGTVLSAPLLGGTLGVLLGLVTSMSRVLARAASFARSPS